MRAQLTNSKFENTARSVEQQQPTGETDSRTSIEEFHIRASPTELETEVE